jgi:hypothetical protein
MQKGASLEGRVVFLMGLEVEQGGGGGEHRFFDLRPVSSSTKLSPFNCIKKRHQRVVRNGDRVKYIYSTYATDGKLCSQRIDKTGGMKNVETLLCIKTSLLSMNGKQRMRVAEQEDEQD